MLVTKHFSSYCSSLKIFAHSTKHFPLLHDTKHFSRQYSSLKTFAHFTKHFSSQCFSLNTLLLNALHLNAFAHFTKHFSPKCSSFKTFAHLTKNTLFHYSLQNTFLLNALHLKLSLTSLSTFLLNFHLLKVSLTPTLYNNLLLSFNSLTNFLYCYSLFNTVTEHFSSLLFPSTPSLFFTKIFLHYFRHKNSHAILLHYSLLKLISLTVRYKKILSMTAQKLFLISFYTLFFTENLVTKF